MQTTLTSTLIDHQPDILDIQSQLDTVIALHSTVQRTLYKDIVSYFNKFKVNKLSSSKLKELKSNYQFKYSINARQFNSIYTELLGKIFSVLELNKDYLADTKDKFKSLEKFIKNKQKILDSLILKIKKQDYVFNHLDKINYNKLVDKLYYLNQKLNKANYKLAKLTNIEQTGNPHLCFGSNKLFRQQFLIGKPNNLTGFKSHEDWRKSWNESRNKSFFLMGSSDETLGNQNCQIKHIEDNIYELKVNINPKEKKLVDRYVSFKIKLHNDKNNLILNSINNNLGKDSSKYQALTYRFYKHKGKYYVFISLDKSKQQPKIISYKLLGAIGIDINADHLSISEIDRFGNLNKSWDLQLNLKNKTTAQTIDNIACAIKGITDYAVKFNKPIVIEKLDFSQKKSELQAGFNKKYNVMLSNLAYSKIIGLIKSRSFDKGIEVIEVNPAYTSKIGKFKYQELYKLTTHQAASFVIARRGLLSYNKVLETKDKSGKLINKLVTIINKEKTISISRSKYYPFDLPVRNSQKQDNIYWKEIEQNYLKAKKHRVGLKRKNLILGKQDSNDLSREITLVADSSEVNRNLSTNLLFMPF
jgi:IS605 OrfB family transposase